MAPNHDADEPDAAADDDRTLIRQGRDFERTYRLDAAEAGSFLVALGEQLQRGDDVTIRTDDWELPFAFSDPAKLEIDYEGVGDPALEIELELPGRPDDSAPDVE